MGATARTAEEWAEARRLCEVDGWNYSTIAEQLGMTPSMVSIRARKEGWIQAEGAPGKKVNSKVYRDIREQSELVIATEVARRVNSELDTLVGQARQDAIVAAAAQEQARVMELHRVGATRTRELMEGLLRELGVLSLSPEALLAFAQVVTDTRYGTDDDDFDAGQKRRDKAMDSFVDLLGLPGRADIAKKLVDSLAKVVDMERRVYGIKDENAGTDALEALKLLAADG